MHIFDASFRSSMCIKERTLNCQKFLQGGPFQIKPKVQGSGGMFCPPISKKDFTDMYTISIIIYTFLYMGLFLVARLLSKLRMQVFLKQIALSLFSTPSSYSFLFLSLLFLFPQFRSLNPLFFKVKNVGLFKEDISFLLIESFSFPLILILYFNILSYFLLAPIVYSPYPFIVAQSSTHNRNVTNIFYYFL